MRLPKFPSPRKEPNSIKAVSILGNTLGYSWSQWQRHAPVASCWPQLAAAGRSWPERYLHRSFWHVRRLKQNATSRAGKNGMTLECNKVNNGEHELVASH